MPVTQPDKQAELAAKFRTRISPFVRRHAGTLPADDQLRFLKQFQPDPIELEDSTGFSDDPLREDDADIHPFADIVHKYSTKILYLTTDECPVYCRYCTRKRRTLLSKGHDKTRLSDILDYLAQRPEVNEVIFSGGDPLMLPPGDLLERARQFLASPAIRYLRFHTRAATTSPGLFSETFYVGLNELLRHHPQKLITFVLHINTAAEISEATRDIVRRLHDMGIRCYAQTVLLKGINDSSPELAELCQALTQAMIQPYYLHQLDRVTGSAHFEVSDDEARLIYGELKRLLPVYLLPKLVRDSKQGKYPL
ncbi:MAG TPA: radical SAM protein [Turneriella sp.]|nr:radical SAM protein [Turneriella sp.]